MVQGIESSSKAYLTLQKRLLARAQEMVPPDEDDSTLPSAMDSIFEEIVSHAEEAAKLQDQQHVLACEMAAANIVLADWLT